MTEEKKRMCLQAVKETREFQERRLKEIYLDGFTSSCPGSISRVDAINRVTSVIDALNELYHSLNGNGPVRK